MQAFVESFGVEYHKIAGDPTAILWEKESQECLRDGKIMQIMKRMEDYIAPHFQNALRDYEEGCKDAEIIVSGPLCMNQLYSIAEKKKVPYIPLILAPVKSGDFPLTFLSSKTLGMKFLNKLTWNLVYVMLWQNEKKRINQWRVDHLKLPAITSWTGIAGKCDEGLPLLMGINRHIIPTGVRPADWKENFVVTGFLFVPPYKDEQVSDVVRNFVEHRTDSESPKTPLIYLGFGSMPAPEPLVMLKRAQIVSEKLKVRVVLCAGWVEISELVNPGPTNLVTDPEIEHSESKITLPETVLLIKEIPHDYLFPHCDAVVHHCGVGTTAAAMRAGVPSLACPVLLDQPFNAAMLHAVGISPPPVPFHTLNAAKLLEGLSTILKTPSMKAKAMDIAADIAKEDGAVTAAQFVLDCPNFFTKPRVSK